MANIGFLPGTIETCATTLYIYCKRSDRTQWDSIHRILVGDGDSILCTKLFVGSDSVSLWLARGRHGRLPPLLVATSCGDAGSLGVRSRRRRTYVELWDKEALFIIMRYMCVTDLVL